MEKYFFSNENVTIQIRKFMKHLEITPKMMTKKLHSQIQAIIFNSMRVVWRKYNVPEVRGRYSDEEFLNKINVKSLDNSVRLYESYAEQDTPPPQKQPQNQFGVPSTSNINPSLFNNPNERFRTPSQQENPSQNLAPPPDGGSYASWDSNFTGQFSQATGEYGNLPYGTSMGQSHGNNLSKKESEDELMRRIARFKDERDSSIPQQQGPPDPNNSGQVAEWLGLNRDTSKAQFTQPTGGGYNANQFNNPSQMGGGGGNGYQQQHSQMQPQGQQGGGNGNYGVNNYTSNQFNQQQGMQGNNGNWNNQQQNQQQIPQQNQQQSGFNDSFNPTSANTGSSWEEAFSDPKQQQTSGWDNQNSQLSQVWQDPKQQKQTSGWDNQNSQLSQVWQEPPDRMKSAINFNKDWESKKKAELQEQFNFDKPAKFDPTQSPNQQFQQQQSQQQSNNFFFAK